MNSFEEVLWRYENSHKGSRQPIAPKYLYSILYSKLYNCNPNWSGWLLISFANLFFAIIFLSMRIIVIHNLYSLNYKQFFLVRFITVLSLVVFFHYKWVGSAHFFPSLQVTTIMGFLCCVLSSIRLFSFIIAMQKSNAF